MVFGEGGQWGFRRGTPMCTGGPTRDLCLFQQRDHEGPQEHLGPSLQGGIHKPKSPLKGFHK